MRGEKGGKEREGEGERSRAFVGRERDTVNGPDYSNLTEPCVAVFLFYSCSVIRAFRFRTRYDISAFDF